MTTTTTTTQSGVEVGPTTLRITLPLPLGVAASVTSAVGALYPDAVIDTTGGSDELVFRFPHDSRCRTKTSAAKIRAAKTYLQEETEAMVLGFAPDGAFRTEAPRYIAVTLAAAARAAFEDEPAAENFLEFKVHDDDTGQCFVVTARRSAGKEPAEMLTQARAQIVTLTAERDEARLGRAVHRATAT